MQLLLEECIRLSIRLVGLKTGSSSWLRLAIGTSTRWVRCSRTKQSLTTSSQARRRSKQSQSSTSRYACPDLNQQSSAYQPVHVTPVEPLDITSPHNISQHESPRSHRSGTTDFDPLAPHVLRELCNVWFTKFHPWLPILHRLSSQDLIQDVQTLVNTRQRIVFKAIVAVTLPHGVSGESLSNEQRNDIASSLRSQVVAEAMSTLCLPSLQAVLIITILDFGSGRLSEFWNLVALSKR